MVNKWREVRLGQLGEVNRGRSRHRPRDASHLYGGTYPFIQTGDIKASGGRITSHSQTYSEAGLAQSRLWPEGTMVITIAGNIAETAILTYPACFPDSVVGFIADQQRADVRFVEYLFRHLRCQIQQENVGTGSVQDNINLQTLARLALRIPPLPEQHRIASILGTLDDKIENNRKMAKSLEAMAQAIFQSWFVDFDPVRAKMAGESRESICKRLKITPEILDLFPDRLVDSELGEIPEGWDIVFATQLIEFNPSEALRKGAEAPYLEMAALPTSGCWPEPPVARPFGSGMRFRNGDTLLARITPCLENGKTAFVQCLPDDKVGWGSTEYIVMRPKSPVAPEFGYLLARDAAFREKAIRSMTGTSGRQRVQAESVAAFKLVAPTHETVWNAFSRVVVPAFKTIKASAEAIAMLAQLRDTLLPKLISGELRVSDVAYIIGGSIREPRIDSSSKVTA